MFELTLQLHHHGLWRDAMRLRFLQPQDGLASACILDYHQSWLLEQLEQLDSIGPLAVASQLPLGWDVRSYNAAPAPNSCVPTRVPAQGPDPGNPASMRLPGRSP